MNEKQLLKFLSNGWINKKEFHKFLGDVEKEASPNNPFGDTVETYDVEKEKELADKFSEKMIEGIRLMAKGDNLRWN